MREAFAVQKLLTFFQPKILAYLRYKRLKFNETLTNDVVNFEEPGPERNLLLTVPGRYFCCGSSMLHVIMPDCLWFLPCGHLNSYPFCFFSNLK